MKLSKGIFLKGWLLAVLLVSLVTGGLAQSIRFSSFYDSNNGAGLIESIVVLDDGSMIGVGSNLNSANESNQDGHHVQIDEFGNLLNESEVVFSGMTYNTQQIIKSTSGSLYSAGHLCDYTVSSPGYCDFYFSKLNSTADTVFTKVIVRKDTSDVLLDMVQTRPNKIMLIGWTYDDTTDVDADLLFITVDTLGNEVNRVVFGGGGTDYVHSACLKSESGNVLMTGYTLSFGAGNGKSWVLETDSIGNVQWYEIYSGFSSQGDGGIGISKAESDGNFIVVGASNFPNESDAYMLKIDTDGNEIWRKRYQIPKNQGLYAVVELEDGTIVSAGQTTDTSDDSQAGWLIKTDANGDTLWTRTYNPSSFVDRLLNMMVLPNGDIVMVGSGRGENSTTQDGWILRVDSMGCEVEGCFTVGIEDASPSLGMTLQVYPNPATREVNLRLNPTNIQDAEIVITDMLGKQVLRFSADNQTKNIDVSHWSRGLYTCSLYGNRQLLQTEKLILMK
tara:strand:+ start:283 stop:1791 length:1509 start_codon:yes stop_codon:yes gene_type:complete